MSSKQSCEESFGPKVFKFRSGRKIDRGFPFNWTFAQYNECKLTDIHVACKTWAITSALTERIVSSICLSNIIWKCFPWMVLLFLPRLRSPGRVFWTRHVRKYEPIVDEAELIHATPSCAPVRLQNGRESIVSLRDIAAIAQVSSPSHRNLNYILFIVKSFWVELLT